VTTHDGMNLSWLVEEAVYGLAVEFVSEAKIIIGES